MIFILVDVYDIEPFPKILFPRKILIKGRLYIENQKHIHIMH